MISKSDISYFKSPYIMASHPSSFKLLMDRSFLKRKTNTHKHQQLMLFVLFCFFSSRLQKTLTPGTKGKQNIQLKQLSGGGGGGWGRRTLSTIKISTTPAYSSCYWIGHGLKDSPVRRISWWNSLSLALALTHLALLWSILEDEQVTPAPTWTQSKFLLFHSALPALLTTASHRWVAA